MDFWHSLEGFIHADVTGADIGGTLTALNQAGIALYAVEQGSDDMTVRFQIRRKDGYKLRKILDKRGDMLNHEKVRGLYWSMIEVLRRPLLLAGVGLLLLLTMYLPTRVFFLQVEGNSSIPTNLILEKCAECGISFGADRRQVRSEKMKNALLAAIPELQWVGINTSGCVATITIRERSMEEKTETATGISSIVAIRDALITECTVTQGSPSCRVGQTVTEGQVLISGYTDCGSTIRAEAAKGEVYGETERNLTVLYPSEWTFQQDELERIVKYSLIIGKKRINFYKGSGILDTSCVKMYSENYISLPGGFRLPVAIVTEVWLRQQTEVASVDDSSAGEALSAFARSYLSRQMIAGHVKDAAEEITMQPGVYILDGKYACTELIGVSRSEEILKPNGEHD